MAGRQVRSSYYKKKFYFSIRERILLHLARYSGYEDEVEVPDALTQFGIADAAGAGRSTCSKLLQGLEEAHLIISRRAHVPSGHIRRTVYFLTPAGADEAEGIRSRVQDSMVVLRRAGEGSRKVRVGDLPREIPVYADLVDIACHVSRGNFDFDAFVAQVGSRGRTAEVLEGMPRVDHFQGREGELKALLDWWRAAQGGPMVLTGPPGIGKTALAAQLAEEVRPRAHVFWYRIHQGSTPRGFAGKLAELLAKMHHKELGLHLESRAAPRTQEVLFLVGRALRGPPSLVILDGANGATAGMQAFLRDLLVVLAAATGPRVLITATTFPKALVQAGGLELSLGGLGRAAIAKLLPLRGIPEGLQAEASRRTLGNPLFLRLLRKDTLEGPWELSAFLRRTILPGLLDSERLMLARAAVDRRPLPEAALVIPPEADGVLIRSLVEQGLVSPAHPMVLDVPAIVREVVLEGLPTRVQGMLHLEAAEYWASQPSPEAALEAIHHLATAGEVGRALALASEVEPALTARGLAEDLGATLREVKGVRGENRLMHGLLRGRLLCLTGSASSALEELGKASAAATRARREDMGMLILLESAEARLALDQASDALRDVERALRILEGMEAGPEAIRAHYLAALAEVRLGDPAAAVRHLRAAARQMPRTPTRILEFEILLALSAAYARKANGRKALSYAIRALKVVERSTDLRGLARTHLLLGELHWLLGMQGRASRFLASAREVAQRTGDLELTFEAEARLLLLDPLGGDVPEVLGEMREIVRALGYPALAPKLAALESLASSLRSPGPRTEAEFLGAWQDLVARGHLRDAVTAAVAGTEALVRAQRAREAVTLLERARTVVPAAHDPLIWARIEALKATVGVRPPGTPPPAEPSVSV